ncbi:MAG: T9SS type A sorting domain-containing protein [Bacteroidales bacterium]|jgi:hypothetical protein|nr:T9SS type A sorting domain-containing protein [Bacteroidales bacterium]
MKQLSLFLIIIFISISFSFSQNRGVTRGATPGEMYLTGFWYGIYHGGPPIYDTLRTAIFRLTENGKKLTIQYDADYFADLFTEPGSIMQPRYILADVTPGVIYSKCICEKSDYYNYTQFWVSFDYGKNWTFREENAGSKTYFSTNVEGLIYRGGGGGYNSNDYANEWNLLHNLNIVNDTEFLFEKSKSIGICGSIPDFPFRLYLTDNFYQTFTELLIDEEFVFGQVSGIFPDIYRGGLQGEVYVTSWFPDWSYKVSFSADTGRTFRHVYICENCSPYENEGVMTFFMSDKEPGEFYIIKRYEIEDKNPWGWHSKICVEYYRNYGETLVDIYCHDITRKGVVTNAIEEKRAEKENIVIYPNPTTGQLRITNYELRIENVEVFDVCGKKQKIESREQNEIDITNLQAGIYFIKIKTEKGTISKKIIKLNR